MLTDSTRVTLTEVEAARSVANNAALAGLEDDADVTIQIEVEGVQSVEIKPRPPDSSSPFSARSQLVDPSWLSLMLRS